MFLSRKNITLGGGLEGATFPSILLGDNNLLLNTTPRIPPLWAMTGEVVAGEVGVVAVAGSSGADSIATYI